MKQLFLLFLSCFSIAIVSGQQYWQQRTDYRIDVTLNPAEKTIDGFEQLHYTNASPDTLHFIWFHLWPNAYKNDRTAFSDQLLEQGDTRFYFSDAPGRGYINRLDFRVNGLPARMEDHPEHIDIIKLWLPQPLLPGAIAKITTPFHVKLPYNISRGGFAANNFQVSQFFPKPAVYDRDGWHPMPYLQQGEFYSEFGKYDVRISVPKNYMVAATGTLQEKREADTTLIKKPVVKPTRAAPAKSAPAKMKTPAVQPPPPAMVPLQTWHFVQDSVHDFAWFASPDLRMASDTVLLASGKSVRISSYFTPARRKYGMETLQYAKNATRFYSEQVGEYPYADVRVVEGPKGFPGGMEYPTITLVASDLQGADLDMVVAHEVGHNWFYGILGSNERRHPWMDEGLNSFFEKKYMRAAYGEDADEARLFFAQLAKMHRDQPIETPANEFTELNYALVAYDKTARWLQWIEKTVGPDSMQAFIRAYYKEWAFRHPSPGDFFHLMQQHFGSRTESFRAATTTRGVVPGQELSGTKLLTVFQPRSFERFFMKPAKQAFIISPAFGYNVYDEAMLGMLFTNYFLPQPKFSFVLAPLYATGSDALRGIGRVGYKHYGTGGKSAELFITGSSFAYNEYKSEKGNKYQSRFTRIAPGMTFRFRGNDLKSNMEKWIGWNSWFIGEQPLRIRFDSIFTPIDTTVAEVVEKASLNYAVHQLQFGIANNRVLYPYSATLNMQGSAQFIRLGFEGKYFFNYKKGGLSARLFAGAFFHDDTKRHDYGFNISRFFLNLSGASGEEDYTYQNYFFGRNRFEGFSSRQIVIRDGGFKVRTDMLAQKVGKTDQWLAAINLHTTVPDKFNPLAALPIKIPLYLFADIGTYAEAWERDANTERFLFDGGLQLSLLNGTVNFYLPLVYSKPFGDYVRSVYEKNRLIRNMSFSIQLNAARELVKKQLPF